MGDVILLSSSDEEEPTVKKKKLSLNKKQTDSDVIELSDEEKLDNEFVECIIKNENGAVTVQEISTECNDTTYNEFEVIKKASGDEVVEDVTDELVEDVTDEVVEDVTVDELVTKVTEVITEKKNNVSNETVSSEICPELETFLNLCRESVTNEEIWKLLKEKFPSLIKLCKLSSNYIKSDAFQKEISDANTKLRGTPSQAVMLFKDIYHLLQVNKDEEMEANLHVLKLESLLEKIQKKINKLEAAEVDFDEEDNSAYLKLDRYQKRATEIHKRISKARNRDEHHGMSYFGRLDFERSHYSKINAALGKAFDDRVKIPFPTLYEVDKCIRKCVKRHDLNLHGSDLEAEVRFCFKELGILIKKRRQIDLANIHLGQLDSVVIDPADHDEELKKKLLANEKVAHTKIDEIVAKFVELQDKGHNPDMSADSDDSNKADSEDDDSNS